MLEKSAYMKILSAIHQKTVFKMYAKPKHIYKHINKRYAIFLKYYFKKIWIA